MNNKDKRYMLDAVEIAKGSHDKSTKVGCVLIMDMGVRLAACNYFPQNVEITPEREQRPNKYDWTVHAEANLLALAARNGVSTDGGAVYCTQIPCSTCMGLLINAGIVMVVCPSPHELQDKWKLNADISVRMADEADVHLVYLELPKEEI